MSSDCPDGLLNTMLLIKAVKSRPCLYVRDHLRYADVSYKRVEWEEITKSLFADVWAKYNDEEKADKVELVMKRWKNLRACFTREIKRQKEPKWIFGVSYKRRPYLYYNDLLFLKLECENAEEDTTAIHDIDLPENNEADDTTVTVDTNIEEISIPEAMPVTKSKAVTNKTKPPTNSDKTKSPSHTYNIKKSLNSNNTESSPNPDTTNANDQDSTHFALSLVPMLNMIPIDERIDAEINILSVLQPFLKRCRDDGKKPGRDDRKRSLVLSQQTYEIKSEVSSNDNDDFYA